MQLVLTQATEDTDGLPSAGEKKIYVTVGDIIPRQKFWFHLDNFFSPRDPRYMHRNNNKCEKTP